MKGRLMVPFFVGMTAIHKKGKPWPYGKGYLSAWTVCSDSGSPRVDMLSDGRPLVANYLGHSLGQSGQGIARSHML